VSTNAGSTDITQAREATVVKDRSSLPTSPEILSEDEIDADFSPVLAILPNQPVHYILYFKSESTKLRVDSKKVLPQILESIHNTDSKNISVIGHSDTAGDPQYNLQLSQRRASAISRILVKKGVDSTYIKTTSHGEDNMLIKTADNVHEPKNRRVEVVVR
jgi:outer membrane protein OmpA-like peptidoglycan-associated protein